MMTSTRRKFARYLLVASRVFNAIIVIILKLPTGDKQKAHLSSLDFLILAS